MKDAQSVTLGPSQLENLSPTKVILVPAQGPNTIIVPFSIVHKYYFGTVPYFIPQPSPQPLFNYYLGQDVCLYPDSGQPPRLLGASENRTFILNPVDSDINGIINLNTMNQPLMMGNDGKDENGNPVNVSGGDGKLEVEVFYYVSTIASFQGLRLKAA